jgi:hypothetical protein
MRRALFAVLLAACASSALQAAPTPAADLMKPPADAVHFVVVSDAGKHGDEWRWTLPDGRLAYRYSQSLRGWITEVDQTVRVGPDGLPAAMVIRGVTPNGDAAETFEIKGGKAIWAATADKGEVPVNGGFYLATGGSDLVNSLLVRKLVAAGPAGINLYPSGHASLTLGPKLQIAGPDGPKTVQLGFARGILPTPTPLWLDDKGDFFGTAGVISVVPAGFEKNARAMIKAQDDATAVEMRAIARRFQTAAAKAPVLFDHVLLFDADAGRFIADRAVLAEGGKITAIGAGGSVKAPAGARVIDGRGKSLVPGIWDSHLHIGDDWNVLTNLATGITSFRSPGTDIPRAVDVVKRRKSGELLMGEPWISQIIDRKDPLAAQGAETVSSEAEAIAAVHKIHDAGLWGVKFYTSMNPDWIAPAAAEAHKLGMHVHGHVPAHMRPLDAVHAGYDEVTHINFVMMQFMPQDVVDRANTSQRIEGPAKFGKDVDLNSEAARAVIAEFAQRKTIIDPTLVVWEPQLTSDGGVPAPAYAPYMGIMSPVYDRYFKAGGYPLVDGYTRDDYRKSWQKLVDLTGALHKAGVTIVAGTDGQGIEIVREIELYKQAGFTPAEALEAATIVPARMVGADRRTGSIAMGKEADMILVDGDVAKDLGALRRVITVVSDGYVMDADVLRKEAGFSGKPK